MIELFNFNRFKNYNLRNINLTKAKNQAENISVGKIKSLTIKLRSHVVKKKLIIIAVGIFIIASVSFVQAEITYEGLQGPTEVRFWDEANAYNGYTLFSAMGKTYLIDME